MHHLLEAEGFGYKMFSVLRVRWSRLRRSADPPFARARSRAPAGPSVGFGWPVGTSVVFVGHAPVSELGLPGLGLVTPPGGTLSEGPWFRVGLLWEKFSPEVPLLVARGGP